MIAWECLTCVDLEGLLIVMNGALNVLRTIPTNAIFVCNRQVVLGSCPLFREGDVCPRRLISTNLLLV